MRSKAALTNLLQTENWRMEAMKLTQWGLERTKVKEGDEEEEGGVYPWRFNLVIHLQIVRWISKQVLVEWVRLSFFLLGGGVDGKGAIYFKSSSEGP